MEKVVVEINMGRGFQNEEKGVLFGDWLESGGGLVIATYLHYSGQTKKRGFWIDSRSIYDPLHISILTQIPLYETLLTFFYNYLTLQLY